MNRKQRRAEGKAGKGAFEVPAGGVQDRLFGNAVAHHQAGRFGEAEAGYRAVLARNPRHPGALCYLGLLAHQSGHSDDGIELLTKAIAADKRNYEPHYNLARMLADVGRYDEAIQQTRKVIEIRPDYMPAHTNLGALLLLRGQLNDALAAIIRGLNIEDSSAVRSAFAIIVQSLDPSKVEASDDLVRYLTRALTDPWCRPRDLVLMATTLLMRDPAILRAVDRVSLAPVKHTDDILDADELASVSGNGLFHATLITAPVIAQELERLLTTMRRVLLNEISEPEAANNLWLPLASSIALQCFVNDYAFDGSEQEGHQVSALTEDVVTSLAQGEPIAPIKIALLASYFPLNSIEGSEKIGTRDWPESVRPLIEQQILNPHVEQQIRETIENLTPVEDSVSTKVREQYEENPYPKWTKLVQNEKCVTIDHYVRICLPGVPFKELGNSPVNILVAGCGTGMHSIQRAQQIAQSNILAIDLSLSSLSYAVRKTREMGIKNIRYAQADILELTSDRKFDVVDSSGVLHHLKNPLDGWRRLAGLVRPGGLMHIGLYSSIARRSVNSAREHFAKQGREFSPAEARRLRTEIFDLPMDNELRKVTQFSDFYSMSEFRDLLFHVQEHQFSLPQIAEILKDLGFTFLGFETPARNDYLKRFPGDPAATSLDNWHIFETENPATFTTMYQFWIQKN